MSHDRSLILFMVFNKRTRDVNPRLKILSCATNDLRLRNEPLKSEFEIGCCKYRGFCSFDQETIVFIVTKPKEKWIYVRLGARFCCFTHWASRLIARPSNRPKTIWRDPNSPSSPTLRATTLRPYRWLPRPWFSPIRR